MKPSLKFRHGGGQVFSSSIGYAGVVIDVLFVKTFFSYLESTLVVPKRSVVMLVGL
jgi:hypothetical protein